jgi:hypothetical protein
MNNLLPQLPIKDRVKLRNCLCCCFTLKELRECNFQISNSAYYYAKHYGDNKENDSDNSDENNNIGGEKKTTRVGRPSVSEESKTTFRKYMDSVTSPTTTISKKCLLSVSFTFLNNFKIQS